MSRRGREFEKAVYNFVKILDPNAKVFFDHKVKGIDNNLHQCDCWINTKIFGHYPLSILVSCKDKKESKRNLDITYINNFRGEIESTGANIGLIYTNTGFSKKAQQLAETFNNIYCCKLYENEPTDIPKDLVWFNYFLCKPYFQLILKGNFRKLGVKTWNDLFNLKIRDKKTVLDIISEKMLSSFKRVNEELKPRHLPKDWEDELILNGKQIHVLWKWKIYKAQERAILIDGSYCLSNQSFSGSQTSPEFNFFNKNPGNYWEEIENKDFVLPLNSVLIFPGKLDPEKIKSIIRKKDGDKFLDS